MTVLNISLPDEIRALADHQVASGRYASISDYLASLIRQDFEQLDEAQVEAKLLERVRCGPGREMGDADFACIRERLEGEIASRRQTRRP